MEGAAAFRQLKWAQNKDSALAAGFWPRSAMAVEPVECKLGILADLDDVTVRITHVASPFPAVIIGPGFGYKVGSLIAPLFVAGPDISDTQIEEAAYTVHIRQRFKKNLWLVWSGSSAGVKNDP